jgi:hypothetical protein
MILSPSDSNIATLLQPDKAVAICQAEGQRLKNMILDSLDFGLPCVVLETSTQQHYAVMAVEQKHQGNLIGFIRKQGREGYSFLKLFTDEPFPMLRHNMFVPPDCRVIEVQRIMYRASFLTGLGLSKRESLPPDYIRL